jgi:RNA polymerase sigma-70 factor (ECF subfamily)
LNDQEKRAWFERVIMPHLDAAYNLARWITRNDHDAEEVVQEAFLRAYRFFGSFRGEDGKAWLLAIVRNTCYTLHGQQKAGIGHETFDEELHQPDTLASGTENAICRNPEAIAIERATGEMVNRALEGLPTVFREALVMRELEGLSYKEIAKIADVPLGTVMSRLARGRQLLQQALAAATEKEMPK